MASESNSPRRDAMLLAPRFFSREGMRREWSAWNDALPLLFAFLWIGLNAAALALLCGTASGQVDRLPSTSSGCALALIFAGAACLTPAWLRSRVPGFLNSPQRCWITQGLSTVPLLALVLVLMQSSGVAAVFAGVTLLGVSWFSGQRDSAEPETAPMHIVLRGHAAPRDIDEPSELVDEELEPEAFELESQGQWLRRVVAEDGADTLEGVVLVRFAAGQKQSFVHVPFCPPFATLPTFSCETDDTDVRFKVGGVYTYGVRIELKRGSDVGEELQTQVKLNARCGGATRSNSAAA